MEPELSLVIKPAIVTVVELGIFLYLYRDNREPFLRWWNLGWFCYGCWWVLLVLNAMMGGETLWRLPGYACHGLAAVFSCISAYAFRHAFQWRRLHSIALGGYLGLMAFALIWPAAHSAGIHIARLVIAGGYGLSAFWLWPRSAGGAMQGVRLLAIGQALRMLLILASLFTLDSTWGGWFIGAATFFHQLAVISMIMVVVEHSKQRALALKARLERAERLAAVGELAAGLAHEIRNPLGAIVNAVHALGDDTNTFTVAERTTLSDVVQSEARRLNRLLTDFVQFAKPTQSTYTPGDVNEMLEEVAALLRRDDAAAVGIDVCEQLAPNLPATAFDADQLRQAVWNIAKNGIESMHQGQALHLGSQAQSDEIWIRVEDAGPGIEPGDIPHIFRPFYSRKVTGAGLGLAIANRIVQDHKGTIDIDSTPGAGTTFTIRLPLLQGT